MQPFLLVLIAAILAGICSCDPCRNLDCASDNYDGQFRILAAATGADLVFGTNRVYDKDQIRFYSLNGTDTVFFGYKPIRFGGPGYDSILFVRFYPRADLAYLRLGNGDIDTLRITYQSGQTKCCGEITKITNFRYNNSVDIPGDKGTQELRK